MTRRVMMQKASVKRSLATAFEQATVCQRRKWLKLGLRARAGEVEVDADSATCNAMEGEMPGCRVMNDVVAAGETTCPSRPVTLSVGNGELDWERRALDLSAGSAESKRGLEGRAERPLTMARKADATAASPYVEMRVRRVSTSGVEHAPDSDVVPTGAAEASGAVVSSMSSIALPECRHVMLRV